MSETDEVPVAEAALEARLADVSADAAALRVLLPAELQSLISDTVVRSHKLYEEFVDRLVLRVARETGLEAATREPASAAEVVVCLGLEPRRALVPIDWILRRLTARRTVEEVGAGRRFRSRGVRALPDAAPVREEQRRHDSSWLPSYTLAETVAQDYPAFLRGEIAGEEVLFAPRRLRLWVDYFSNANGQYAVSNHVGAIGVARWLPRAGGVILEVGGGLGSGAVAVLERLEAAGRIGDVRGYRFTELVPAFLRRGQQALEGRFRRPAWLRCDALDMNRPFGEQGVRPGDLAVVYAVNALHVAHDLAFTLGEVHRALAPGGELVEGGAPSGRAPSVATRRERAPLPPVAHPAPGLLACDAFHLERVEPAVDAVERDQLLVATDLRDAPVVDDDDPVGVPHGRQPVRDHEHGPTAHELGQRLLDHELALRVEVRGRLVEDQDRRILEERAGDRDPLALAAGEAHAPLADERVVTVGARQGEVEGVGLASRTHDLLDLVVGPPVGDVVADRGAAVEGLMSIVSV